ncbi:hypothetical protein [Nonomuraea sp. NPDC049695]|uniref:deazapurine DNA modification protein DpdA family protein n=1 Tax=Nonomuraea sp. NPDC049695 TaxID=3154734 RepID=UPI003418CC51
MAAPPGHPRADDGHRPVFLLGAPEPSWLRREGSVWEGNEHIPLFVSYSRMRRLQHTLPRARGPWALDSSGYMHLRRRSPTDPPARWSIEPQRYIDDIRRYRAEVGQLLWAAQMDYMVEAEIRASTGLSTLEHQRLTTENLLLLRSLAPELPIVPSLQGWTPGEYRRHRRMYAAAGIDLREEPLVGLGSVCRRQASIPIHFLIKELAEDGIRLHAYGFGIPGLSMSGHHLVSADSQAWSLNARRNPGGFPQCTHRSCSYCPRWALAWHRDIVDRDLATAVHGNTPALRASTPAP